MNNFLQSYSSGMSKDDLVKKIKAVIQNAKTATGPDKGKSALEVYEKRGQQLRDGTKKFQEENKKDER
jgi:hypothetical protein